MKSKSIVWFEEVDKSDVELVGGKGANLGEMLGAGFPIPYGFIVTSRAYFDFVKQNNLAPQIKSLLDNIDVERAEELAQASSSLAKLILNAQVSKELIHDIAHYYDHLAARQEKILGKVGILGGLIAHLKSTLKAPLVAVRSSATAEDLPTASFAGQQETFLNVKGENHLIQAIRKCWASLFTERAIYYRAQQGFDHMRVGLAAVVQLMVQSEKAGVAFSINPVANDKSTITIEAIFGLGEYIVQGSVDPDHYEVDKEKLLIKKRDIKNQRTKLIKRGRGNAKVKLSSKEGTVQKISDLEIIRLADVVRDIERHYYFPQDIEWAYERGRLYIVQSRPITTVKEQAAKEDTDVAGSITVPKEKLLLTGDPASPGIGFGRPVVLASPKENDRVKTKDILVAQFTSPDYVPAMKRSSAIVTEMGGRTSHAAIVSRELGIPAVVGVKNATKVLGKFPIISVNGSTGQVFKGNILSKKQQEALTKKKKMSHRLTTTTRVYVNLAQPDAADRVAKMNCDGIGLLRAEFIIADIGTHPKLFIEKKREKEFVDKLVEKLLMFVKPFSPRPIVYRATDFKTNEYKHLKGGERFEPKEENPMIGYRGASRYIQDEPVFAMEIAALKRIRAMGYKNINLMIPFVRLPQELLAIKKILAKHDLLNVPSFKLWIMVEVPSSAIMIEDFLKVGIDGVSVGTNDLTMLLLGVDRDNQDLATLYDERYPVVLWALERVIKACKRYGVTSSICGQAPSDYPDLTRKLVKWGITSVSVTPDVLDRTRALVYDIEKEVWQKSKRSAPVKS